LQAYKLFFIALNVVGMPKLTVMFAIVLSILSILFETAGLSMIFPAISYLNNDGDMAGLVSEFPLWLFFEKATRFLGITANFASLMILTITLFVVGITLSFFRAWWINRLKFKYMSLCRHRLATGMIESSTGYLENYQTGDLLNDLQVETERTIAYISQCINAACLFLTVSAYMSLAVIISPKTVMTLAPIALVLYLVSRHYTMLSRNVGLEITKSNNFVLTSLSSLLTRHKLIKISNKSKDEGIELQRLLESQANLYIKGMLLHLKLSYSTEIIGVSMLGGFLYVATQTFGVAFAGVATMAAAIYRLIPRLKEFLLALQSVESYLGSVLKVADRASSLAEKKSNTLGTKEFPKEFKFIEIRNVDFEYKNGIPTLAALNAKIPAGKITAIVGPTGSGKSTLLDLLLGLRQPTKGEILIQTTKVSDITRESIAKNISFSPQETQIFSGSLAAHVYYGNESRTLSEVTEALKYSEALEFFGGASSKSAITLERDAFLLSGGQKKRLDLARCILKDPQLLLLDEPTGNLDARTEHEFGKTLKKMCKDQNKTIILIGHQMSLVQIADNIIILKDGSIECQGSNKYVSTRSAWYREAIKGSRINPKKLP